jgi:hypothetical protein
MHKFPFYSHVAVASVGIRKDFLFLFVKWKHNNWFQFNSNNNYFYTPPASKRKIYTSRITKLVCRPPPLTSASILSSYHHGHGCSCCWDFFLKLGLNFLIWEISLIFFTKTSSFHYFCVWFKVIFFIIFSFKFVIKMRTISFWYDFGNGEEDVEEEDDK